MSTNSSRARIRSVVVTATRGAVVMGVAVACEVLRAAGAAGRVIRRKLEEADERSQIELRPLAAIHSEQQAATAQLEAADRDLPDVARIKVETANSMSMYVFGDKNPLAIPLCALESARTVPEARDASRTLLAAAAAEHHRHFNQRLVAACSNASAVAGFHEIATRVDERGTTRIVATSDSGAALVTEIHAKGGAEPDMVTEVVGVHDGSCKVIMDRFDAALEAQGVRTSAPQRRLTGGVCELAAAREFLRGKIRPRKTAATNDRAIPNTEQRNRRASISRRVQRSSQ